MTQRIEYTEEMVGNAHPTKADTLNRLVNVITAQGDIIYGTAAATAAALAKGAANLKMFMNAGATAPEWANGFKTFSLTRDMTAGSADVAYTTIGFKGSAGVFFGIVDGTEVFTLGVVAGTSGFCINYPKATAVDWNAPGAYLLYARSESGNVVQSAILKSWDADGFTLTWVQTGNEAGILSTYALIYR